MHGWDINFEEDLVLLLNYYQGETFERPCVEKEEEKNPEWGLDAKLLRFNLSVY